MMKRLLCFVTTALLLCMPAAAPAQESDYLGEWYLQTMEMEGEIFNVAEFGMTGTLTLCEGGLATFEMFSETEDFHYTIQDGAAVLEGDGEIYMIARTDGDTLIGTNPEEPGTMVFTRTPIQAAETSPVRRNVQIEDFAGIWQGTQMETTGIKLPLSAMDMTYSITIAGGAASVTDFFELTEDSLPCVMNGDTLVVAREEDPLYLNLREDGTLSVLLSEDVLLWMEYAGAADGDASYFVIQEDLIPGGDTQEEETDSLST